MYKNNNTEARQKFIQKLSYRLYPTSSFWGYKAFLQNVQG